MEEFSFALAVAITPVAIGREVLRLMKHQKEISSIPIGLKEFQPSLMGMGFSFLAGLIALKILSKLLEKGQWWLFGVYCLAAASGIYWMHLHGYGS
jgi:undecaprenyl-diphosphatase